jgi:hypothetical protein
LCVHPGPASIKTQMNKNKTKFYILLQHDETVKFFYAETMKFLHAETVTVTTKFYMLLQQVVAVKIFHVVTAKIFMLIQ